jgi:type IV secretion system protein VirB3
MQADAIYKGATRPAMKLGVPLVPLVVSLGIAMLLIMWIGALVSWWIAPVVLLTLAPALGWMNLVTRRDDQRLRQLVLAAKLRFRDRNRRIWRSRSYAPYAFRGARHAGKR